MRYLVLTFLCILWLSACQPSESSKISDILEKAYQAHGNLDNWTKLKVLRFEKEYSLYNIDGSEEASAIQQHEYRFDSTFSATISWEKPGEVHRIEHDATGTRKFVNDSLVQDPAAIQSAHNSALAARFTGTQPFQLLDPGTRFSYMGLDTLENGKEVEVLKAEYDEGSQDTWWHYFDPKTGRCVANLIYHAPTYAYVLNLSFDERTPFVFHGHRKTFRTDSLRDIQYLRAEYFYRNYEVEME